MSFHGSELQVLIEGHLANTLDEAQQQRLMEMLRSDPSARQSYLEFMDLHAELQWSLQSDRGVRLASEVPAAAACEPALPIVFDTADQHQDASSSPFGVSAKTWTLLGGFVATIGLVSFALFALGGRAPINPPVKPGEIVTDAQSGSLHVASGVAKLVLPNVGYVMLEGPVDFKLLSEKRARMSSGRIKMYVTEESGRGFVVETPYGEITDQGTEFGVDLKEKDKARLVVFNGIVDLRMAKESPTNEALRLVSGDGVTFDSAGRLDRIMSIVTGQSATFQSADEAFADGSDESPLVSARISDNLPISATKRFYEIVRGGFGEDVRAYVDRNYEWNGLDERGIPDFLRGVDYILPFNDDKWKEEAEITLALARPAVVYIMFDDRGRPPRWLRSDFVDTGFDIGLDEDEGPVKDIRRSVLSVDRGAGKSIDRVFSVWKREVVVPGKVMLGPRGGVTGRRAMYGIAVAPLPTQRTAVAQLQ